MSKVYGYVRVSTQDQADTGHSLNAQRTAIQTHAAMRGWTLNHIHTDRGVSTRKHRPALQRALTGMRRGDTLIATRLDRICRSTAEFCAHAEAASKGHWTLILLDQPDLDMTRPTGRAMMQMLAVFAEFEREMIRARTREGLEAAAAAGRFAVVPDEVRVLVCELADRGLSERRIADHLSDRTSFRPPRGGERWSHGTIRRILTRP